MTTQNVEIASAGALHAPILSKDSFLAADKEYQRACARRDAAYASLRNGDRWGEARRFSGGRAGRRLDRIERANAAWSKAYDAAEKRWIRYSAHNTIWYAKTGTGGGQGLVIDEADGRSVAVSYDEKDAPLLAAAPKLRNMLARLTEKVARANSIQHSGGEIQAEDWAELYQLANESRSLIEETSGQQGI